MDACLALAPGLHRVRLSVDNSGQAKVESAALAPSPGEPVRLLLADTHTQSADLFLRHKTSVRSQYDAAWRAAEAQGAFDALFFNEKGELTEGGRSNVFVRVEGRWYTPPVTQPRRKLLVFSSMSLLDQAPVQNSMFTELALHLRMVPTRPAFVWGLLRSQWTTPQPSHAGRPTRRQASRARPDLGRRALG